MELENASAESPGPVNVDDADGYTHTFKPAPPPIPTLRTSKTAETLHALDASRINETVLCLLDPDRRAWVVDFRSLLAGHVEADEGYCGWVPVTAFVSHSYFVNATDPPQLYVKWDWREEGEHGM